MNADNQEAVAVVDPVVPVVAPVAVAAEPAKEFLNRSEAAKLLGVSYRTLVTWNGDGTLRGGKIGRRYFYSRAALVKRMAGKLGT